MLTKDSEAKDPQDVNKLIRDSLTLIRREIEHQRVSVLTELFDGLPHVLASRVQLRQVIINLIMNAVDAMSTVADRERILQIKTGVHELNYFMITVEDSGIGIDPKHANRIFEAFFTTKSHGMGMGLAICRSIVESHGGRLSASPGRPHGSIFQVLLPTASSVRSGEGAIAP